MPAILWIDVDMSYENRILHYARVNQELFMGIESFGYFKLCKEMIKDLNDRGIKASVFFQPFTMPNKDFAQELVKFVKWANRRGHVSESIYRWIKRLR